MDTQLIYRALTRASDEQLIEEMKARGFVAISRYAETDEVDGLFAELANQIAYEEVAEPQRESGSLPRITDGPQPAQISFGDLPFFQQLRVSGFSKV